MRRACAAVSWFGARWSRPAGQRARRAPLNNHKTRRTTHHPLRSASACTARQSSGPPSGPRTLRARAESRRPQPVSPRTAAAPPAAARSRRPARRTTNQAQRRSTARSRGYLHNRGKQRARTHPRPGRQQSRTCTRSRPRPAPRPPTRRQRARRQRGPLFGPSSCAQSGPKRSPRRAGARPRPTAGRRRRTRASRRAPRAGRRARRTGSRTPGRRPLRSPSPRTGAPRLRCDTRAWRGAKSAAARGSAVWGHF